jgi:hypothetical protein
MNVAKFAWKLRVHEFSIEISDEEWLFPGLTRNEKYTPRIRSPRKLVYPSIKVWQHILGRFRGAVVEDESKLVGFVAGAGLGAPRQIFSVG